MLYYCIIDLVTSIKRQSIHQALTEAQIKQYNKVHKSKFMISQEIVLFAKKIMDAAKTKSLKQSLKNTKIVIESLPDNSLKAEKRAIYKIAKIL